MDPTLDVLKLTINLTTGRVTDALGSAVTSTSNSTGFTLMSNPLVRLVFQKTVDGTTSAFALPTGLFWTATLDNDFNHENAPIAYVDADFNANASWESAGNPSYAGGQMTFTLNLATEGGIAKLGKHKQLSPCYLDICGWSSDETDAQLVWRHQIEILVRNVLNPSNVAAVPYDVDQAVADLVAAEIEDHDESAASHATVPTSVTTAISTHNSLNTAHGMTSMSAAKAHVESAHSVVTEGGAQAGTSAALSGAKTGGAVGASAAATTGGAVGASAVATTGFAGGAAATGTTGAAVGAGASAENGGAVGAAATESGGGFAGGAGSTSTNGAGAIGAGAIADLGGAVGKSAVAADGFAGGKEAKCLDGATAIDAVQLGTGTNGAAGTLQVYTYQLMGVTGNIPVARLALVTPQQDTDTTNGTDPSDYTSRFIGDILMGVVQTTGKVKLWIAKAASSTANWVLFFTEA